MVFIRGIQYQLIKVIESKESVSLRFTAYYCGTTITKKIWRSAYVFVLSWANKKIFKFTPCSWLHSKMLCTVAVAFSLKGLACIYSTSRPSAIRSDVWNREILLSTLFENITDNRLSRIRTHNITTVRRWKYSSFRFNDIPLVFVVAVWFYQFIRFIFILCCNLGWLTKSLFVIFKNVFFFFVTNRSLWFRLSFIQFAKWWFLTMANGFYGFYYWYHCICLFIFLFLCHFSNTHFYRSSTLIRQSIWSFRCETKTTNDAESVHRLSHLRWMSLGREFNSCWIC